MSLLRCPHCGQTYNPRYIMYCARCGEPVPDRQGKLPRPGPYDGYGARGGALRGRARGTGGPVRAPVEEPAQPVNTGPSQAVEDIILECRNRLNEAPQDHGTRYSLALAYLYGGQWDLAEQELLQVAAALPDFADAHARLAFCLARRGAVSQALEAARTAARLEPTRIQHRRLVAQLEEALRRDTRS